MIGCLSYSIVNGENTDTFNLQNELDFSKNYEYDSDNRIISTTISALSLAYDYDDENVGSLSYSLAQGATKSFSYQYDENGNIVSEQVTVDGVSADITAYEYDEDNQLVSAENGSTKWTYSYDNRGNLTAENEYSVSFNESGEKVYTPKENGADSYTYDTNWKDKLTSYNGQTISYDESGNPTSYLGHNLSWTMGRQLASYDNTTYSYNESGIRTSKTVGENTTEFYLNGTNIIYQTDGTSEIHFFYDRNNELVGFKYSGNNYFYVKNQMGDITDIADENGNIVASYSYDPWGSVLSVTGSDTAIGNLNPFRYRSYYYDDDIGMYYLQSRYYNPEVGRFINCDDINYIGHAKTVNSYNAFSYCNMNDFVLISISSRTKLNKYSNDPCWTRSALLPYYIERYVCFSHGKNYSFEVLIDLFLHGNDSDQIGAISLIAEKFPEELYDFLCDCKNYIPPNKLKFLLNVVVPSYLPLFLPKEKLMGYEFRENLSDDVWVKILSKIKKK